VSDGDTLTVMTAEKRQVRVRLLGIDPPETGQDYGTRAKQAASSIRSAIGKSMAAAPRSRRGTTG
jgi:micrococcal nuclease